MLFQNPNHQIFESTVNDEILFGPRNFGMPREEAGARGDVMLEVLGLGDRGSSSPHTLSLGEKRRLNVGSVAVYEPNLYLLDEPFVGQDQANVDRIMAIVRERVKAGASCMVVTHDPDFAHQSCDRIAFLKEGRLLVQGRPAEVFPLLEKEGERWYLPSGWRAS
jgi:energy-coupling factor transport system ATP-binding protein